LSPKTGKTTQNKWKFRTIKTSKTKV